MLHAGLNIVLWNTAREPSHNRVLSIILKIEKNKCIYGFTGVPVQWFAFYLVFSRKSVYDGAVKHVKLDSAVVKLYLKA